MRAYLRLETERLRQRGARLRFIGRRDRLPELLVREIERGEFATASGRCLQVRVAVDYSSRDAVSRVVAGFGKSWDQVAHPSVDQVRGLITQQLTSESGEVDLLIRTGGEKRLSDFLLWESAYAELWFTDRMWPDFDPGDMEAALKEFRHRERRFGGVPETAFVPAASPLGGAQ